jgi:hypothetical protein
MAEVDAHHNEHENHDRTTEQDQSSATPSLFGGGFIDKLRTLLRLLQYWHW